MKIMNKIFGFFVILAIFGFVLTGCDDGGGIEAPRGDPIEDIEDLYGTWKTNIDISIKIEDAVNLALASMKCYCVQNDECGCLSDDECNCGIDITVRDLKNFKNFIIRMINEEMGSETQLSNLDWDEFLEFITEDDEQFGTMLLDAFETLEIDSWETLQTFINNTLATVIVIKAEATIELSEEEVSITVNSASFGLSGGNANYYFETFRASWELLEELLEELGPMPEEISDLLDLIVIHETENKIYLKEAFTYSDLPPSEDDLEDMEGFLYISNNGNTISIPVAYLINEYFEIDISKWINTVTFQKQN